MALTYLTTNFGAEFSQDRQYRYALWRIWDRQKPIVMFVGLNPSTANETTNDPTIKSVCRIAKNNGFGGVFMMNCFPYVSTDPQMMAIIPHDQDEKNDTWLISISKLCQEVVFAWGNFDIVKTLGKDQRLSFLFPNAKALHINKNGSPKHPLYCKSDSTFVDYTNNKM